MSAATVRSGDLFFAAGAAVAFHAFAFALLVLLALAEILIDSRREKVELLPPPPPEDVVVELSSNTLMAMRTASVAPELPAALRDLPPVAPLALADLPEPNLVEEAVALLEEKADRNFTTTSPEQEAEVAPTEAAFIGERDTVAASEGEADPDGPAIPTQEGEEQEHREENLFDSDFSDGDEPDQGATPQPEAEKTKGSEEAVDREESSPAEAEPAVPEEAGKPKDVLLENSNEVPVPTEEQNTEKPREETLPKKQESESEASRKGEGGESEEVRKKPSQKNGFRTEKKKTRVRGSLKRKGRSALDVENTALGRYRAKVYRECERVWQQQCITYRNHILPGTLTLRFFVGKRGNVSGLRYIYEFQASEIQKGFSVMSVRQAKIPPMPREVVRELDGEPMECVLDLHF